MRPKKSAKPKLGRLEKIEPVDYWQSDADFLQWLEDAENLELLSEALGYDLAVLDQDRGSEFPTYLLCEDVASETVVLVMPQVTQSDVLHLGQLVTWAAQEAVSQVIWVTAELTPEQSQALAWLNRLGDQSATFEGIEVELWRIGKNAMAANFHPIDLASSAGQSPDLREDLGTDTEDPDEAEPDPEPEPLTAMQQENLEFWTDLSQQLERRGSVVKPGAPTTDSAMGFAMARADFRLYAILDRDHDSLHVELLLSGVDAHPHFYLLAHEQALVEDEIGYPLIWDDSGQQTCAIACSLPKVDIANRETWLHYQTWFCEHLEQLYDVFYDRVKYLDATAYEPLPDYRTPPLTDSFILPASGRP
jgi:hypothetical protein